MGFPTCKACKFFFVFTLETLDHPAAQICDRFGFKIGEKDPLRDSIDCKPNQFFCSEFTDKNGDRFINWQQKGEL